MNSKDDKYKKVTLRHIIVKLLKMIVKEKNLESTLKNDTTITNDS